MKQRLRDLEARKLWIEARVDELMDDDEWLQSNARLLDDVFATDLALQQATREHASLITDLEEAMIDSMELK